ncbi:MAG: hypothetical protein ABSD21_12770 [Rhizomicrobium sp.]|jgi:hypothetical protein
MRHVTDFFLVTLNRPFAIDHPKPIAASQAFDFVGAIIVPLGDVSDTELMPAIRAERGFWRKLNAQARQQSVPAVNA